MVQLRLQVVVVLLQDNAFTLTALSSIENVVITTGYGANCLLMVLH